MSHDRGRHAACSITIWILWFHFDHSYDSTRRDGHGRWLWRLVRRLGFIGSYSMNLPTTKPKNPPNNIQAPAIPAESLPSAAPNAMINIPPIIASAERILTIRAPRPGGAASCRLGLLLLGR